MVLGVREMLALLFVFLCLSLLFCKMELIIEIFPEAYDQTKVPGTRSRLNELQLLFFK
jgi:hypothetical protein